MDFFASQETARRNTKRLVGYFAMAVIGLVASLYLVIIFAVGLTKGQNRGKNSRSSNYTATPMTLWDPSIFLWSSLSTLAVIGLGSGYKSMQLAAGGRVVAQDLGGKLVDRNTTDTDEKRLLNVVEEMAIAAGMPVPDVYLLEGEDGINAFAAGHGPGDAIIGVTRGCMRTLTRDELQGVMAHEFSHILNGDMKLNLRLIGVLHGILIIAIIGRVVLRIALESRGSRDSKEGGLRMAVLVLGGAVMALGYLGVLFGNLIKAAISRQREFLADASAVQFTRNPEGIAGALQKIGGLSRHSYLRTPMAEEASHMLFGKGRESSFFDTHPPLEERIKRIAPHWNGEFPKVNLPPIQTRGPQHNLIDAQRLATMAAAGQAIGHLLPGVGARLGTLDSTDLARARALQFSMPDEWRALLCHPSGAQAMMFALLLSEDAALLETELVTLRDAVDEDTLAITLQQLPNVREAASAVLIAVIDLAIPALRRLTPDEYQRFAGILQQLMDSDHQIDLFEFMVQKMLRRHLDIYFQKSRPPRIEFTSIQALVPEAHIIISVLARTAGDTEPEIAQAYASAQSMLTELPATPLPADWSQLDTALDRFNAATPLVKKQLLFACGHAVMADGAVRNEEAELLRAVADTIGCPVPPFVDPNARAA